MAGFTRAFLREQGLTDEQVSAVMGAHLGVTDALKERIHTLETEVKTEKADSEKLAEVQKQLDDAQKEAARYKTEAEKNAAAQADFDKYKSEQAEKETRAAKTKAYRELLKDLEMSEKGIEKAVKYADFSTIELDEKGKLKDAKSLKKSATEEWSEYLPTVKEEGTDTANPPANNGGKTAKTREEIVNIKDDTERQREIAANPELFGITT